MSWFDTLSFGRRSDRVRAKGPKRNTLRRQPYLETLERRDLLTGSISLVDGVVTIEGTAAADTAVVTYDDRGTLPQINDDRVIVTLSHDGVTHAAAFNVRRQVLNLQTMTFDWVTNVSGLRFDGYAGNDTFRNDSSLRSEAHGGDGDDHLVGGSGADVLFGDAGDDNLEGRDGRDYLWGGEGNDTAYGGAGKDVLRGGVGNDWLLGGDGNDYLYGDNGRDVLAGEAGDDCLDGGVDGVVDDLWGGTGADVFVWEFPGWEVRDFRHGEGDRGLWG